MLAAFFARKYAEANGVADKPLSPEAMAVLKKHKWPGNVRELENTIHRAVLLASGDAIGPEAIILTDIDGTPLGAGSEAGADGEGVAGLVGRTVADVERDLIIDTLKHCLGNRTHAANILGISIRTLRNKLKQYTDEGHDVPAPGAGDAAPA